MDRLVEEAEGDFGMGLDDSRIGKITEGVVNQGDAVADVPGLFGQPFSGEFSTQ